jgi:polyhydroxyalkanoate synthesis regulator phasin
MDFIKKFTLASIGVIDMTREKAEELLDELVKRGEMTNDERAEALRNFVNKSIDSGEKMKKWAEENFEKFTGRISMKVNEQITQLSDRIEQLNVRLGDLERKINKSGNKE